MPHHAASHLHHLAVHGHPVVRRQGVQMSLEEVVGEMGKDKKRRKQWCG